MKNSEKIILHLCADSGSDSQPYREAGYDVRIVGEFPGVQNYKPPKRVYGIIANPVCTQFSIANQHVERNTDEGMILVNHCLRIIKECNPVFWVIENPATGKLKDYLGKPEFTYEPWEFGSPWTKRTALWGKFNKPEKLFNNWDDVPKIEGLYTRPGRSKPSLAFMHKSHKRFIREFDPFEVGDDMSFRSLCPQTFAKAFFRVNK